MSVSSLHLCLKPCADGTLRAYSYSLRERRQSGGALLLVTRRRVDDRRPRTARADQSCCRASPEGDTMLLAQISEELPTELPPFNEDVLLPLLFFTAPLLIYLAIRLLLWDYKSRPEDPRELKEGPWSEQKAQSAEKRTYAWGAQPRPAQPQLAPAEAISESAGALVFQSVMASQRLLRIRCAHDILAARNSKPGASWYWATCLLGLPEALADQHMQAQDRRPPTQPVEPAGPSQQPSASANGTPTASSTDSRKISTADIQLVQNLIERCLQLYMSQREVVYTLSQQAKIETGFTLLVWQKLEEQNPDFFRAYYTRLKLKDQIVLFNHLLEQQVQMFHKVQQGWFQPPGVPAMAARPGLHLPGVPALRPGGSNTTPQAPPLSSQPEAARGTIGLGDTIGDLIGIPRNFSLSDLALDQLGSDSEPMGLNHMLHQDELGGHLTLDDLADADVKPDIDAMQTG
ncbi:hypothetical protein WJX73_001800 [Symbiochloris irregularis]|uniref:Uncharacterized protein n=1 Tax=Symbiochloris irregularis TaxID=706552 RepID=A0AAW1PD84_9CHLO